METMDESFSDSDKLKFQAFYDQMKSDPAFAEFFRSSSQKTSESVRKEPTMVVSGRRDTDLKATHFEEDASGDDQELALKNDFIIEERCRSLASQSKFYEAISVLEDLNATDDANFGLKLLKAECFIQLGRETKAEKALKDVKKILMRDCMSDIDDVMSLAEDLTEHSNNVRALLLFQISGDMFMKSSLLPDEKVGGIFRCIAKMQKVAEKIISPAPAMPAAKNLGDIGGLLQAILGPNKAIGSGEEQNAAVQAMFANQDNKPIEIKERSKIIALDYGITVMEEMLKDLKAVDGADPSNKAVKQAILANAIQHSYSIIGQHDKALKSLRAGVAELEKHFGKNANQYKIYITMLVNIGACLHNSEKFRETEKIQLKALDEIDHVLDFNTEEERQMEIKRIREVLRITRLHLKLQ